MNVQYIREDKREPEKPKIDPKKVLNVAPEMIREDKSKPEKNHDKIIDKIQKVRKNNNTAWMDLLRLAFKHAPDEAKKIFSQITKNDKKINELSQELSK